MSSVNRDIFPIWMLFISFSCLIALAKNSGTVLSRSGECGNPCLVPEFRGKTFSFSLLGMMLSLGLLYMTFLMLGYFSSITNLLTVFIMKRC